MATRLEKMEPVNYRKVQKSILKVKVNTRLKNKKTTMIVERSQNFNL